MDYSILQPRWRKVTHSLVHAGRAQRTVTLLDENIVGETLLAA